MDAEEAVAFTLENPDVVTKYKMAGEMATRVMGKVIELCVDGASTFDICSQGDAFIYEETKPVFNKKVDGRVVLKGIGFPVCLSVNNCVCHYSPLKKDSNIVILKDGDLVKIDLGVHLDGYVSVCAHTLVVGASADKVVTGKQADATLAAYYACEAACRLAKPGASTKDITAVIAKVAEAYGVTPVKDMLCFQLEKNTINGEKSIVQNPSPGILKDHKESDFEEYEAFAIDVLMSTGEGKARQGDERATVFKQTENFYSLKTTPARSLIAQVGRFANMPFSFRAFDDVVKARAGVPECIQHQVLEPYDVLYEKKDEFVAQFRATVLLMPNGNLKIASSSFDPAVFSSDKKIEDKELLDVLARPLTSKSKKKKKKSKKKIATEE